MNLFLINTALIISNLLAGFSGNKANRPAEQILQKEVKMTVHNENIHSSFLEKNLAYDVFLPPSYESEPGRKYKLLFFNDGQDMLAVKMYDNLKKLYKKNQIEEIIVVAIRTDGDRLRDYGTISSPDYKKRGDRAALYGRFVVEELLPVLRQKYRASEGKYGFAGFSLGGLSAFSIAWAHPAVFDRIGVFSGAFWWRKKAYEDGYDDENDRIMHNVVKRSKFRRDTRIWLEAGTEDEESDRNNNGVIDSIEDTLHLLAELEKLGYRRGENAVYFEVPGGKHNFDTWSVCLPDFLRYAYGK